MPTENTEKPTVIAIDGPAAAGKGTLARGLGQHFGYAYLDTGSLYRAVALMVLAGGGNASDPVAAIEAAAGLDPLILDNPQLRTEAVGKAASEVAAIVEVRAKLMEFQRKFAKSPPDGADGIAPGAVIDGRDIGTVICPDADVKIYVTASDQARARRRLLELESRGERAEFGAVLVDLQKRDARDRARAISPLRPAEDAHLLDTTDLDIEGALRAALDIVEKANISA